MSDPVENNETLDSASLSVISSVRSLQEVEKTERTRRKFLSFILIASYLCLGTFRSLPGPTLYILKHTVNEKLESLMVIFTARSLGYICGYMSGGAVFDNLDDTMQRRLIILVFEILCAITAFAIPFCPTLASLSAAFFATGICLSALDTGFNTYMLQMWGRKSNPYYLSLHFFFGAGGLIGPVLARIFVEDISASSAEANKTINITVNDIGTSKFPSLLYSYIVLCCMILFVSVLWLATFCCPCDVVHLGSSKAGAAIKVPTKEFTLFAVTTTCILIFLTGSIDAGYVHMLATYALEGYNFSTVSMVNLTAIFWGFYTIGGALAIFFAHSFHPFFMIILCLLLELGAGLILVLLSKSDNDMLAFGNALLGLGAAALCGWTILWMDRYIVTTYKIISSLFIVEALSEMIIPQVLAIALQKSTDSLSYFVISIPILFFVFLIIQSLWFFPHGEKFISLSRLPEKKRKRRICPIFLEIKRKGSDEAHLERMVSSSIREEPVKDAFLVTKKDSHCQTEETFLSDVLCIPTENGGKEDIIEDPPIKSSQEQEEATVKSAGLTSDVSNKSEELEENSPERSNDIGGKPPEQEDEIKESEEKSKESVKNGNEHPETVQSPDSLDEKEKTLPQRAREKSWDWFGIRRSSAEQKK